MTKEKIDFFLDNGVDINHQNMFGTTALMFAVKGQSLEIVKYLIDKGADTSLKKTNGKSAFDIMKNKESKFRKYIKLREKEHLEILNLVKI